METGQSNVPQSESEQQKEPVTLTAYNVRTKEKNVPILDAVITKTAKGGYMAQGVSADGAKLTTLLGEAKALACIEAGLAKKGWE